MGSQLVRLKKQQPEEIIGLVHRYRIVKELTGRRMQSQQIKMTNGKFAKTHEELVNRWQEHFQSVLNCPQRTVTHD